MKRIFHVILSDNTVTFLDGESLADFMVDFNNPDQYNGNREFVVTTSDLQEHQYKKLLAMRDENMPEPQKDNQMAVLYHKLSKPAETFFTDGKTNWDTDFNTEVPKPFTLEKLKAMTPEPMRLKGILHSIGGTFKPYGISFTYHDRRVNGYRYKCTGYTNLIDAVVVKTFNTPSHPNYMIGKRFVDKDRNVCEITYCNYYNSKGFSRATTFVVKAKFVARSWEQFDEKL